MKRILCFGDSNTYGYDPRDGGRYDANIRWVDLLGNCGYEAINEGLNGREIPVGAAEYGFLNSILYRNTPIDILILALGVNDAYNMINPTAKKIRKRWEDVFVNVKQLKLLKNEQIPIILVSPPVGPTDMWGGERAFEIMGALNDLAGEYEDFAKCNGLIFADANKFGVELAFDGVHFTERGSVIFFENIRSLLS